MEFRLIHTEKGGDARAALLKTDHGVVETPVFMPVGTQASVKTQSPRDLHEVQAQIILANTYHLYMRPGAELLKRFGGIHNFMRWNGPVLTDSGGYQVYSLKELRRIDEEGVRFQSHLDGSYHTFTPGNVLETQRKIGSDIMMVLDECPPADAPFDYVAESSKLTTKWAREVRGLYGNSSPLHGYDQWLFAIVQGGVFEELREQSARDLIELDFPGYAIGGLAVGEPKKDMFRITQFCSSLLPENKPRYLMGVGTPVDLLESISRGVDMFDCVMPTRNARNGTVFGRNGKLVIKGARFKEDERPIDDGCSCYCCKNFSRAYIRHLLNANEVFGIWLTTHHNLHFYLELMRTAREHILQNNFENWKKEMVRKMEPENKKENELKELQ